MNLLNQYSYLLVAVVALFAVYVLLRRYLHKHWLIIGAAQALLIVVFTSGFFILRPGSSSVDNADVALAMLENGRPTFVEFFSNYCSGCLSLNPIVEAIVSDIQDDYNILRVDIHTPVGRELRQELGFSFTPEFVIYDIRGNEMWRDHIPPTVTQLDAAKVIDQALKQ